MVASFNDWELIWEAETEVGVLTAALEDDALAMIL